MLFVMNLPNLLRNLTFTAVFFMMMKNNHYLGPGYKSWLWVVLKLHHQSWLLDHTNLRTLFKFIPKFIVHIALI